MAPRLVVPAGTTFFEQLSHTFDKVEIGPVPEQKIPTASFLEACDSFVTLFHTSEGVAFGLVEKDMAGNIAKVRERFLKYPLESVTLQDLVNNELKTKEKKATEGLFWLTRGLEFTSYSIKHSLENPDKELATSFIDTYQTTLKPYHGWIAAAAFQTGLKATPYRKDFFPKLGEDQDKVNMQAKDWLSGVNTVLDVLNPFMNSKKKDLGIKV